MYTFSQSYRQRRSREVWSRDTYGHINAGVVGALWCSELRGIFHSTVYVSLVYITFGSKV